MEFKKLLTTRQAAEILNVAPGTLVMWRSTRRVEGPSFARIGHAIRYELDELVRWVRENTARLESGEE